MKNLRYIISYLLLIPFLFSCANELIDEQKVQNVPEGLPVSISLSLEDNDFTKSGFSSTQEKRLDSLAVLIFDGSGVKVAQSYYNSNIPMTITNIPAVSGNNMSVYVIANLTNQNTGMNPARMFFDQIHSITDLNQMILSNLSGDLTQNRSLFMTGSATGLTFAPNSNANVPISLKFGVARVTLYVYSTLTGGDTYNLSDWTVVNYPQKTYAFPQTSDVVGSNSGDYANTATSLTWVDTVINSKTAKYAFLYMFENRRGTNSNTLESQKGSNVPNGSTAIVLNGFYYKASSDSVVGMKTTIYLGANNYNDYNVQRNYDYVVFLNVTGMNQANVDTRVVTNASGYSVKLYNPTLDCHPDWRPIQVQSWQGTSTVQVLNTDGVTPCTWLNLSSINLNQAVNNLRPTYNPSTDMVKSMTLTFPGTTPAALASQMIYLYADENFSSTSRSAIVKITSTSPYTNEQIITKSITQYGYQTMGTVGLRPASNAGVISTTGDYILAVENNEEVALNLTPGATAGTEALSTMMWGFSGLVIEPTSSANWRYYYRNGFESTMWLVYGNYTGGSGSTLRPPYGRANASTTITENAMHPIFNTYPARYCFEKNRDLDGDGKITNPNTLGVNEINWYLPSAEELVLVGIGQSSYTNKMNSGSNYANTSEITSSTTTTQSYIPNLGHGGPINKTGYQRVRCVRKLYASPSATSSPYVESGSRIINTTGFNAASLRSTNVTIPTPLNAWGNALNYQFPKRFIVSAVDVQLNGNSGGTTMTWSQAYGLTTASDASTSFVIASPATGCQAYSETGYPAGTWRLPTQNELYMIFLMQSEIIAQSGNGFTALANTWYYSSTYISSTQAIFGLNTTQFYGTFLNKTTGSVLARCIRDL